MKVLITGHSKRRLKGQRQGGIDWLDIVEAARTIPGRIPRATRFRGFVARSGKVFDLVVKDSSDGRIVITVIGKNNPG